MRARWLIFASAIGVLTASAALAQDAATRPSGTPQPQYPVAYGKPSAEAVAETLGHVRDALAELAPIPGEGHRGGFSLLGYPMGVAYAGMLEAGDATGDKAFGEFDAQRFEYFAQHVKKEDAAPENGEGAAEQPEARRDPFAHLNNPRALDDCGAMGASFIKARRAKVGPDLMPVIDRFAKYISSGQFRLNDGTLARNRPFKNSIWGDDMYMSVPFLAQMGLLSGERSYFDDAAKQVMQIGDRLFVPGKGLFTHAWNAQTGYDDQPHYYWGRANGWCMMAMVELLSVLPEDHPQRDAVLHLLRAHARGVASVQAGDGLWHQMLDQNDTYEETSASAMFTFALARGVNRGWLDASAYGPVAIAGWNGVASRVSSDGHVSGTCIGTSYADDATYYAHRPMTDDQHGYGPVLMAGAEIIRLVKNPRLAIVGGTRGSPVMVVHKNAE